MIVPPENPDGKELFLRKKPYILRSRKKKSRVKLFLIALALLLVFVAGIAVTSLVKADRLM